MPTKLAEPSHDWYTRVSQYPLINALLARRSRRFGKGMRLTDGPLAYRSTQSPQPLSLEEEALLAFAACGITGYALAELPYEGGGNIMTHFIGRTVASADALHIYTLFVINDDGVWLLKRPQDYPRHDSAALIQAAREHRFVELYEQSRVRIANHRLETPRAIPFTYGFNQWSANVAGSTYFLPIAELTAPYINGLLFAFDEEFAGFAVDERNWHLPAGLARFARSQGGHLHDDPSDLRLAPISYLETWLDESAVVELGGILQNLALMSEALGLGGFTHCATHPFSWFQALGFRMESLPASRLIGAKPVMKFLLKVLKKDVAVPTAVGFERDGQVLIKPYCPPYYRSMEEAVRAFVAYKYAEGQGTLRDGGQATAWRDGASVQKGIPRHSDQAIAATIAYCDYLYRRYGRFPANSGPFRTVSAFQAHHLDADFYERFYTSVPF